MNVPDVLDDGPREEGLYEIWLVKLLHSTVPLEEKNLVSNELKQYADNSGKA